MSSQSFDAVISVLSTIILSFVFLINLSLAYVILSKHLRHQAFFIFLVCFAMCDVIASFSGIFFWTNGVFISPLSCKLMTFLTSAPWNLKPALLSTVFVIYTMRSEVNKRASIIIIATLSISSLIGALPEGFDAEIITYENESYCVSSFTRHPLTGCIALIVMVAVPTILLTGYFMVTLTRNPWSALIQKSPFANVIFWFVVIHLIFGVQYTVLFYLTDYFTAQVFEYSTFYKLIHFSYLITILSMTFKPIIVYFKIQEFEDAVNQIIQRENNNFVPFENEQQNDEDIR